MKYDIFFSISQTPVEGVVPNEATMLQNFFDQVQAADQLGYRIAWIAQAHLSTEVQKRNARPVVPHWQGEVGLCTDFFQLAHKVFAQTSTIEVGSAVMSILCNGGPIGAAERVANFCALHGLNPNEQRRLHLGFSAGRFEFMARPYGVLPRDLVEEAAWPALRGQIFMEAGEIFLRLLRGDVLSSEDTYETVLTRSNFRSDEDWEKVRAAARLTRGLSSAASSIPMAKRYAFEELKIIPQEWRRELLSLIVGSHDPRAQKYLNQFLPVKVFNLSITQPEKIEATHERMTTLFHSDGGGWQRHYMPRTVMVFLNDDPDKNEEEKSTAARENADRALSAYWKAIQGTLDPTKVERAADNALIGSPQQVAEQIAERFNSQDALMLWFDFFNHNSEQVIQGMRIFKERVIPLVEPLFAAAEGSSGSSSEPETSST